MRTKKGLQTLLFKLTSYLAFNLRTTLHFATPMALLGLVAFPVFYIVMPRTEQLWLDLTCTLACVVLLFSKNKLKLHSLVIVWYLFLILIFPFNFSYNLLVNPHDSGYELGEMIMLITVFAMISDTLLIILLQVFGIGAAAILFFLQSGKVFIPADVQAALPWYILGMILGLILSNRRNRNVKQERIYTKFIEQEKESLAYLSRKNSIKEAIMAVAHELNQPLSAVKIYTQACQRRLKKMYGENLSSEIYEALSKSSEQAQRAGDIIHTLKDFLCEEEIKEEPTDLNQLIQNVIRLMEDGLNEARIKLQLKLDPRSPKVMGNHTQLELVLVNLIKNALESMVVIEHSRHSLIIRTAIVGKDKVIMEVEDSGEGIQPDIAKKLFLPFVSTKENGVGLGLSLSYNIIQRHGGTIQASPAENEGSIFTIILPLN